MNWETFYFIAFLAGFVFCVVSFLAGSFHAGHGHFHFHGHGHAGGGGLRFLNLGTAAAFLTWFGGAGFLLQRHSHMWVYLALLFSVFIGLVGAGVVFWVVAKLSANEHPLDPADYEMVGVLGRVTSPIRPKGTGEILFARDGARKASPARSEDSTAISRDTEVIVTRYENGIAYVRRWEEFP